MEQKECNEAYRRWHRVFKTREGVDAVVQVGSVGRGESQVPAKTGPLESIESIE